MVFLIFGVFRAVEFGGVSGSVVLYVSGLIYKVLSITYSRLLRGTYINYNAVEFFRGIAFSRNICK